MAHIVHGDQRYPDWVHMVGVAEPDRRVATVRSWWHRWRWPAGLLAGVVIWLALVSIAGATTPATSLAAQDLRSQSAVIYSS